MARSTVDNVRPTILTLQVEKFRLIAYISFWLMCLFAMLVTTFAVAPTLGPCQKEGNDSSYGLHCSILMENFGFNNICVNWDYSPSREATALIYPVFEYSLLIYIFLNFYQIRNDFDNDKVGSRMILSTKILFWVKIVLVAWFRMIFIVTVTQDSIPFFGTKMSPVVGHTLGFLGMQVALILVAFENVVYLFYTNQRIFGMPPGVSKKAAILYLSSLIVVTVLKVSWAISLFANGTPWIGAPWPHIFDRFWMVLAAVLPIFFAINGMRTEPEMEIILRNKPRVHETVNTDDDMEQREEEDEVFDQFK